MKKQLKNFYKLIFRKKYLYQQMLHDYVASVGIIKSCKTYQQIINADNIYNLFYEKYEFTKFQKEAFDRYRLLDGFWYDRFNEIAAQDLLNKECEVE